MTKMTTKTKTRDDARRRSLAVVMNVRPSRKRTSPPPSFFSRRVASRRVASRAVARLRLRRNSAYSRVSDTQSEINLRFGDSHSDRELAPNPEKSHHEKAKS
jgi:hypothetical protein